MYQTVIYEKLDGVGIITLNRPQRMNAISRQMINELLGLFEEIEKNPDVKVVIVTGAPRSDGRPCFSAGADLKELAEGGYPSFNTLDGVDGLTRPVNGLEFWKLTDKVRKFGKPTIAAIDGVCTAGGIELAMCFDIRLVSQTAEISDMHIKNVGRPGGGGAPALLCRLVGPSKAKEMIFTCNPIDGKEAWRIGFANQVFPPDKLMASAKEMAAKIATMYSPAVRMAKAAVNAAADMDMELALRYSYLSWVVLREATGDEGARALSEKRKPTFTS